MSADNRICMLWQQVAMRHKERRLKKVYNLIFMERFAYGSIINNENLDILESLPHQDHFGNMIRIPGSF